MAGRAGEEDYRLAVGLLAEKVLHLREARGLTQEQLAERAQISRNQVQNLEKNRGNQRDPQTGRASVANARLDTIFALAAALEVDVTLLIDPHASIDALG